MSTHLITGYAGREHITSADQGSFNAAVMGGGEFVLERGEQFRCQVVSNNKVRIYDGDALMQGRHIIIDRNTYEETTHDNGTQGYKRVDLIVLTYEKNAVTSVESVKLEVIKGSPAESNPAVPEYTKGDILNSGASKNQMPLYQIPFDGLSIGEPVKLFSTVPTLEGMKADIDGKVDEKIAEFEEDFAELEAGIEDKIAEAGKPLASNAADWAMIENYGEYSADAKTVGEEFSKVNNSLTNEDSETFNFGIKDGVRGFFTNPSRADDSFIPFSSGGYLALVSTSRKFNITNIVGSDNLGKYNVDDFICIGVWADDAIHEAPAHTMNGYAYIGWSRKISDFIISYDSSNGDVNITGGIMRMGTLWRKDGTTNWENYTDVNAPVQVYMLIKTPNANI